MQATITVKFTVNDLIQAYGCGQSTFLCFAIARSIPQLSLMKYANETRYHKNLDLIQYTVAKFFSQYFVMQNPGESTITGWFVEGDLKEAPGKIHCLNGEVIQVTHNILGVRLREILMEHVAKVDPQAVFSFTLI